MGRKRTNTGTKARATHAAQKKAAATPVKKSPASLITKEMADAYRVADHVTATVSTFTVTEAIDFVETAHGKQTDKAGRPYIEHLLGVLDGVKVLGGDHEQQLAALGHDLLEDTGFTRTLLRMAGFSERAVTAIEAVTKPLNAYQDEYLDDIVKHGVDAIIVKAADIMHNLRKDRIAALLADPKQGQHTVDRLHKKYRPALARLLMEFGLIVDEDTQKKLATKPIGTGGGSTYTTGAGGGISSGGKTVSVAMGSLILGDWITYMDAPILRTWDPKDKTKIGLMLANGQVRLENRAPSYVGAKADAKRMVNVWEKEVWYEKKVKPYNVTDEQIADFMEVILAATATGTYPGAPIAD